MYWKGLTADAADLGDSEVGVHKIEGRQKKVRRERGTQRHRESGTGGQSGGNRAGRQLWDNFWYMRATA